MEDRPLKGTDSLYGVTEAEFKMSMDDLQRSYVDEVAEEYGVELEYDEGEVEILGVNIEQIEAFVRDVYSKEKSMNGKDHPNEFGFPDDNPFSMLESEDDSGKEILPDGGKAETPTDHDLRYDESNGPYTGEELLPDSRVKSGSELGDHEEI